MCEYLLFFHSVTLRQLPQDVNNLFTVQPLHMCYLGWGALLSCFLFCPLTVVFRIYGLHGGGKTARQRVLGAEAEGRVLATLIYPPSSGARSGAFSGSRGQSGCEPCPTAAST